MNDPDLKIAGFELEVHGREFPDATDYWDANWLLVTARCRSAAAIAEVGGPILMTEDLQRFQDNCEKLQNGDVASVDLAPIEPELRLTLTREKGSTGQIKVSVRMEPTTGPVEEHSMEFGIEQSYLTDIIRQCTLIVERYPEIGSPED